MTQTDPAVHKTFEVMLDLKYPQSNESFEVVEGDMYNYLNITLYDSGAAVELDECRVIAVFSHSGGTAVQDSAATGGGFYISGNSILLHINTGSVREGIVECELQIFGSNPLGASTTAKFNFSCRKPLLSEAAIESDSEYTLFTGLLSQVAQANVQATSAISIANTLTNAMNNHQAVYVAYSMTDPTSDDNAEISTDIPGDYMGVYNGSAAAAPSSASDYVWHKIKGETISSCSISDTNELMLTLTDNSTINSGKVIGTSLASRLSSVEGTIAGINSTLGDINTALGAIIGVSDGV